MSWNWLPGCGYLYEQSALEDGHGRRKTTDLLHKSILAFAKGARNYHQNTGDLPFTYRERQLHSILLPALAKTATAVLFEQPTKRKPRGAEPGHGWIDYWILHRDALFLMEVKHAWHSFKPRRLKEQTQRRWTHAIDQLRAITYPEARSHASDVSDIFRVAMLITPFYKRVSSEKPKLEKENAKLVFSDIIMNRLNPRPNWGAVWLLQKNLQEFIPVGGRYEWHPAVAVSCFVDQVPVI